MLKKEHVGFQEVYIFEKSSFFLSLLTLSLAICHVNDRAKQLLKMLFFLHTPALIRPGWLFANANPWPYPTIDFQTRIAHESFMSTSLARWVGLGWVGGYEGGRERLRLFAR